MTVFDYIDEDGVRIVNIGKTTTGNRKLAGMCNNGHPFELHGHIEKNGRWRCSRCRKERSQELRFFDMVDEYKRTGDPDLLAKIEREYYQEPQPPEMKVA